MIRKKIMLAIRPLCKQERYQLDSCNGSCTVKKYTEAYSPGLLHCGQEEDIQEGTVNVR